ncbi:MAG: response regulator [Phycisphaerae bacterium]|nr:response regulator [Phycisphaerae bacterium]MCZ2400214.1 response regulator [Phycisphaerae bacterium]
MSSPLAVCLVEDEARLHDLLVREVRAMGHDCTGFRTAELAWPALAAGTFHAALLDLNLPGESGVDLFRRIREADLDVAVVILTGYGSVDTAVQALRWHADDYLSKPCSLRDIEAVLARVAARRRERRTAARLAGLHSGGEPREVAPAEPASAPPASIIPGRTLEEVERRQILATLKARGGDKPAAARDLGISLRTLYNKLNIYKAQGFWP